MKERKLTVNITKANIFSIILMAAVAIPTIIVWILLWGKTGFLFSEEKEAIQDAPWDFYSKYFIFMALFVIGIVAHELVHGLTWAHYASKGWKTISFGVMWKMLTPYCHCDEPLQVRPYCIGALMPCLVMGIVPWMIGLCVGSLMLTTFGVLFIAAASGDILIVWELRNEPAHATVLDHPTEAGCIIYKEE